MTSSDTKQFREQKTLDTILPKKGKYAITIAQLESIKLKQNPPPGCKVVLIITADGNTRSGVTTDDKEIPMTSIRDIQRVNAARGMAHKLLGVQRKTELEQLLCETVAEIIGPVDPAKLNPSAGAVQELRRVRMDYDRVAVNKIHLGRVLVPTMLEQRVQGYMITQCDQAHKALREYMYLQLVRGSEPRENISLQAMLLKYGIPRSVYGKLIQPGLVENIQIKLDRVLFGQKVSKGLRLSLDEMNCDTVMSQDLVEFLLPRNNFTLTASRSKELRADMESELDEIGKQRLNKIQLLMIGPGDYSKEWAEPQPMPVVAYQAPGELLLKINQLEVNFHSGVIPVGVKATAFWSNAVTTGKEYPANLPRAQMLTEVIEDAKKSIAFRTDLGCKAFSRDLPGFSHKFIVKETTKHILKDILAIETFRKKIPDPPSQVSGIPKGKIKVEVKIDPPEFTTYGKVNPKNYLESEEGKAWALLFIPKVFLKTATESDKTKKVSSGIANINLPPPVINQIKGMQVPAYLKSELVNFLTQFQSESLAKQAFKTFSAEIQRMEMDGTWVSPDAPMQMDAEENQSWFD